MAWRAPEDPCLFGPETRDINGRLMLVDSRYPSSARGIIKCLEIVLCFLALILVGMSKPVQDERGIPIIFAILGILIAFAILVAYILALNTRVASTPWFVVEATLYVFMIAGLLCSSLFMWLFCANHWSSVNPDWDIAPSLAAGALFVCALIYLVDLAMLVKNWKRWSWQPQQDPEETPATVLPY